MGQPFDSTENLEALAWSEKTRKKQLNPSKCFGAWLDICGFGSLLKKTHWNLNTLQEKGYLKLLDEFHMIAGSPIIVGVEPNANEKVIVLNDGIARTVDLAHIDKMDERILLFYIRDLISMHYLLLKVTKRFNVGIRTIITGGERVQYTVSNKTGYSHLYFNDEKISKYGKKILETTYVYNPAEFQTNTAFAKAYTIDSMGSKHNIKINGLYIEKEFLNLFKKLNNIKIEISRKQISIHRKQTLLFELMFSEIITLNLKGLEVEVFHITKFIIHKEFDGDDIEISTYRQTPHNTLYKQQQINA